MNWLGLLIPILGYGFIIFVILYAHKLDKRDRKIIIDRIKARGYKIVKFREN